MLRGTVGGGGGLYHWVFGLTCLAVLLTCCLCGNRYYPPPSSLKSLTPSWDMAPAAEGVTIVFTFIESWGKLKAWNRMEELHGGSGALDRDLKKLQAVVRTCIATVRCLLLRALIIVRGVCLR